MGKSEIIITKGRISASDFGYSFTAWGSNFFTIAVGLFGLYYVNTKWKLDADGNNIFWGNIALVFIILFSCYMLFLTNRKLKTTFYPDSRLNDTKERIIQKLKTINHWRLEKTEKNYYLFFENNILIQSYYITIVFDEKGFYLNCFPRFARVFDFGRSKRWCNELYDSINTSQ